MRPHTKKLSAIGTAIGLVLMASAVSPAMAAKPAPPAPTVASSYSCSYFKGLTSTSSSVSANGVALTAGDKITVKVDPARTGDEISFTGALGTAILFDGALATSGYTYTAPATGVYSLAWSLDTSANGTRPASITWTFTATCSSTAVTSPSPTPTPTATTKPGKGRGK